MLHNCIYKVQKLKNVTDRVTQFNLCDAITVVFKLLKCIIIVYGCYNFIAYVKKEMRTMAKKDTLKKKM